MIAKFAYGKSTYLLFKDLHRELLDQVVTGSYFELAKSLPNSEKRETLSVVLFGCALDGYLEH
jgi:hypothetical protein